MQPCRRVDPGGGGGGGAWGAHVLPLGLSKHETQRFIMRLAHYLLQPSTDLYMNHCFKSCKLKSAAPKRQSVAMLQNTKADSEEKGLREMTIR